MKARAALWAAWGVCCVAAILLAAHQAPELSMAARPAFALAFSAVSVEILVASRLAPVLRGPWLWSVVLPAVAVLSLVGGARLTGESAALATVALLAGVTALGAALGSRIEKPGHLCAVALVSALADLWSVFDKAGPSAALVRSIAEHPDRVPPFALCFPMLGSTSIPGIIGAGDVLFCALYLAAFERHQLQVKRAVFALALAFGAALALLLWLERALPLLPLLGMAAVLADVRTLSLDKREGRTVLIVSALLCVVLAVRLGR